MLETWVEGSAEQDRLRKERDFYRKLLTLGSAEDIGGFLNEALALMVQIAGARIGYIELSDDRTDPAAPDWWTAHGCSNEEVDAIRRSISRGVIAEALATGRTIVTASALGDPRFKARGSVQRNGIQAVVCAPIGPSAPVGVIYLQERTELGAFTEEDRLRVEEFAEHAAQPARALIRWSRERSVIDHCAPFRKTLRLDGVIGRSASLAQTLRDVAVVAPRDVTVLLTGPTGTGKTEIARVIHASGPRSKGEFVEVNCAALPDTLFESELFGAAAGAHSAALKKVEGKVASAEGGTLFLDEIGEVSLASQAKLLQFLQSKKYFPLGSSRPAQADIRIIAATNANLTSLVQQRQFRQDLFFRLNKMVIRVPSLGDRLEDTLLLAEHFLATSAAEHRLPRLAFSNAARRALETAAWPGNVRQLADAVESAALRAAADEVASVEPRHLFPAIDDVEVPESALSYQDATRRFQASLVLRVLEETSWNAVETARRLDLGKSHVYNLIKVFGLDKKNGRMSGG